MVGSLRIVTLLHVVLAVNAAVLSRANILKKTLPIDQHIYLRSCVLCTPPIAIANCWRSATATDHRHFDLHSPCRKNYFSAIRYRSQTLQGRSSMDQCRSRLKLSENFERHWSIPLPIIGPYPFLGKFVWTNGPELFLKFPPTLVLVHGWLFPVWGFPIAIRPSFI